MADPVISISPASSIGANFATLNASITPNATDRAWADGTVSDTEYFFEWLTTATVVASPIVRSNTEAWVNTASYPPPTAHVKVSGSSPITVTKVAYGLTSGTLYRVRFCAWRILFPGAGSGTAYERASQPHQLFVTAAVEFTTL